MKSSLRQDQWRFDDALDFLERALDLCRADEDGRGIAKALLEQAKVFREKGDLGQAISFLGENLGEIDVAGDSRLSAAARLNRLYCLAQQGHTEELKSLAADLVASFEAREIHREAMTVLILFQRACEEGRMTADVVTRVAALLCDKGESGRDHP